MDTRIAFEGLVLGLYRVGVLPRASVETVLHTMENHAHDRRSPSGSLDIAMLLLTVMERLPSTEATDFDDELDEDERILMNA